MKSKINHMLNCTLSAFILLAAATACTVQGSMAETANKAGCSAGTGQGVSQAGIEQITLCIESGKKTHSFTVENAKTSMRAGVLAAAIATSALFIGVAPQAHAATGNGPYYQVELSQPAAVDKQLIRGVFVKCEATACRAPLASSAPKNVCISIARKLGEVSSFKAGNRVFDATEIAACNEKTKAQMAKK